jgi:tRNA G46 methylase TrmB
MDHLQDLTKLGIKYMTDKAYFHSFTEFYNNYFYQFQKLDNINILEIGIGGGGSLRMLNEFFPNANIYAIDINTNYVNTYY